MVLANLKNSGACVTVFGIVEEFVVPGGICSDTPTLERELIDA